MANESDLWAGESHYINPLTHLMFNDGSSIIKCLFVLCFQRLKEQLKLHQAVHVQSSSNIIHRAMTEAVDMVTSQDNGMPSPDSHMNHSHHPTTIVANNSFSLHDVKRGSGSS